MLPRNGFLSHFLIRSWFIWSCSNDFTWKVFEILNLFFSAGSGLHTFVLYLGPHIALFTIKAVQCGRVDIKSSVYDTIQLYSGPSWLDRNCTAFGPPMYSSLEGSRIPLTSILPQIQLEALLWGIGTALGELPPYFISRAGDYSESCLYVNVLDNHFPGKAFARLCVFCTHTHTHILDAGIFLTEYKLNLCLWISSATWIVPRILWPVETY